MAGRKAAIGFVLATLGLDAIGVGLIIPIVPELVKALSGQGPAAASLMVGALVTTFAAAQFVSAPILGALSDAVGRRKVILLSITGVALNYLAMAFAPTLAWLFAGRIVAGITAGNVSATAAYIADITPPEQRAQRFGLVSASFSFAFVVGPAIGGLLGHVSLRLPFLAAAALAGCNALFGLFVLPESLPRERRRPFAWKGANPVASMRMLGGRRGTALLGIAWASMWFSLGTLQTVFVLSTGLRFGWDTRQNGIALAVVGVTGALVQTFLTRRAVRRFGERRAALAGFTASGIAYLMLAVATQPWMVFVSIVVQAFGNLAAPAVRALASAEVGPERQGAMMGALSGVEGLTAIVSPFVAGALFRAFAGPGALLEFPGAPFLASVISYVIAFAAILSLRGTAIVRAAPQAG